MNLFIYVSFVQHPDDWNGYLMNKDGFILYCMLEYTPDLTLLLSLGDILQLTLRSSSTMANLVAMGLAQSITEIISALIILRKLSAGLQSV